MSLRISEVKPIVELSNAELIRKAGSVGATEPYEGTSGKYSFVPTYQAVNFLRDAGWIPVDASESKTRMDHRNGYQRHVVKFARHDLDMGDKRLMMSLYNSHDAGSSFLIVGAVHRLVCSNGLVVPEKGGLSFRHRHVGFTPDIFIDNAREIATGMERIGYTLQDWSAIALEPNEMGIYATVAHQMFYKEPAKAPIRYDQLLVARRSADRGKTDLWTTFNTVQENLIKGGVRGRNSNGNPTKTRAVKSIEKDRKLNQALWTLTEKMLRLLKMIEVVNNR